MLSEKGRDGVAALLELLGHAPLPRIPGREGLDGGRLANREPDGLVGLVLAFRSRVRSEQAPVALNCCRRTLDNPLAT
jgi:hypothetical protein